MERRLRFNRFSFLLLVLFLSARPLQAEWKALQEGFDYQRVGEASGHFFRIDPKKYRIDLLLAADSGASALTAERYRERSGALLAINGGYFDEAFRSLGLLVRQSRLLNPLRNTSWGIFFLGGKSGTEPAILHRRDWKPEGVRTAIQVGPRLVIDGSVASLKDSTAHRRSAIGITSEGMVLIALSDESVTLRKWAELLQKECRQALNLDGGGSSQISVNLPNFSLNLEGLTGVPNAIAVFPY